MLLHLLNSFFCNTADYPNPPFCFGSRFRALQQHVTMVHHCSELLFSSPWLLSFGSIRETDHWLFSGVLEWLPSLRKLVGNMKATFGERAAKIREDLQQLPTAVIQQHRQFFDDVWNFCGAVVDAETGGDGGQFVPPSVM
jgi:hypothetical protein